MTTYIIIYESQDQNLFNNMFTQIFSMFLIQKIIRFYKYLCEHIFFQLFLFFLIKA